MLELQNVSLSRNGRHIVADATLSIAPGTLTVVLGPNGAGKTTLLRLMSGELRANGGIVTLDGRDLAAFSARELARRRAVLAQQRAVGFHYTAREVVALGRYVHGPSDPDGPARVARALELVGASHLASRSYDSLSGGEAVKIDVARILAQESSIVFLDEPTTSLDARVQYDVLALFHHLTRRGVTVVAALHDLNHAALFADHVVLMKDGEIVADGLPAIILEPELLHQVYGLPCAIAQAPNGRRFIIPDYAPDDCDVFSAR